MLNSNSLLFAFGAITFLVTFSWFKYAAMEVFKKELKSDQGDRRCLVENCLKFFWWIG